MSPTVMLPRDPRPQPSQPSPLGSPIGTPLGSVLAEVPTRADEVRVIPVALLRELLGGAPAPTPAPGARCAVTVGISPRGVEAAVVAEPGVVLSRHRADLPGAELPDAPDGTDAPGGTDARDEDAGERLLAVVTGAVDAALRAAGRGPGPDHPAVVGIGAVVDGVVGPGDGVSLGAWHHFPLAERLQQHCAGTAGGTAAVVLSPASALLAAEHWRGAARGRRGVLAVDWGTRIEGAILLDGRPVAGTTGNAGQIGHLCVDPYGPRCACGARGCLQAVAGGAAIADWYRRSGGARTGLDAADVVAAASDGDVVAAATLRRAAEAIGQAAAGVVTLLDLDVVVLGGELAAAGPATTDAVTDGYQAHAALGYAASPRIVAGVLGADRTALGAAAAVLHGPRYRHR